MKKTLSILLIYLILCISTTAQNNTPDAPLSKQKKLALIVGNANYEHGPKLHNPTNDADSINKVLLQLGFKTDKQTNASKYILQKAIDNFCLHLKKCDVGMFFFAGHGVQIGAHNYLVPVDAQLETESDVENQCIKSDEILAKMDSAGCNVKIIILDANRDNPYSIQGKKNNGFVFVDTPANSFIAYATSPGGRAHDGRQTNGLFTSAILQHINTPGISINELFKLVQKTVWQKSEGKQAPWTNSTLSNDFYFME